MNTNEITNPIDMTMTEIEFLASMGLFDNAEEINIED